MTIEEIFIRIGEEIPGYEAAAAGTFAGEVLGAHSTGGLDLAPQLAGLAEMVAVYHRIYDSLGGIITLGGNDELLLTTSKHYLLTRLDHERQRFLTVAIAAAGNIGYLRIKMKKYLASVLSLSGGG